MRDPQKTDQAVPLQSRAGVSGTIHEGIAVKPAIQTQAKEKKNDMGGRSFVLQKNKKAGRKNERARHNQWKRLNI